MLVDPAASDALDFAVLYDHFVYDGRHVAFFLVIQQHQITPCHSSIT
jgi:hypothetical protein